MTFDEMVDMCAAAGEPFQSIMKSNNSFQANLLSKHGNGYAVDTGKTPTQALENVMRQRRILAMEEPELEDII